MLRWGGGGETLFDPPPSCATVTRWSVLSEYLIRDRDGEEGGKRRRGGGKETEKRGKETEKRGEIDGRERGGREGER